MSLALLTHPDGSPVAINPDEVVHLAPVPTGGPLMGPLTTGTRIVFRNQSIQDVKELVDVAIAEINAARAHSLSALTSPATVKRLIRSVVSPLNGYMPSEGIVITVLESILNSISDDRSIMAQ